MEGISDIKIDGIDDNRPPSAKYPTYINLYFRLNHKAPEPWCFTFNDLMAKHSSKPKILPEEGLYIETWVQNKDQIAPHLEQLKSAIKVCTDRYINKLDTEKQGSKTQKDGVAEEDGPQAELNRIVRGLVFED